MSAPPVGFNVELFKRRGVLSNGFCSEPHPDEQYVWCRRQPGHTGQHAAFVFSIRTPTAWH